MPVKDTREVPLGPPAAAAAAERGPEVIARYLKTLPGSPGVYRMLDAAGEVIYVGKARSLKARVTNYARLGGHTNRIARMIAQTAAMEFVTVRTEAEALLLEANLIKRFRPRFNVLMRDDKSFPFILIARDHRAPQIMKHRGARNRKGDYFGPFASAGAVNRTVNMLQRAFRLRSCSDSVFETRTRPCLLYQIKRCSAPCTGEIELEDYGRLVDEATRFLKGESQNVRRMYQRLMQEASDKLEFERAADFRNRLWALAHVTADQAINPEGIEEADVFAAHQAGGQTCVEVFFFRSGQNWGNRAYFPRADRSLSVEEVLDSFIAQFYDDKPVPRLLLLSHDVPSRALLAEALSTKAERRVEVRVPRRGAKTGIVEHALQNAREALGRRLAEASSQRTLLAAIAERLGLPTAPRRIEVFDNSHIMGANAVGAMIVAGAEGFVKSQYRKFNIKSADLAPGDDYAMMREVLTRRFKRLVLEESEALDEGVRPCGSDPASTASRAAGSEGSSPFVPSPLGPVGAKAGEAGLCASGAGTGEGQGGGDGRTVDVVAPPTPSPSPQGGGERSRIEAPTTPALTERGADAIALGVLRADDVEHGVRPGGSDPISPPGGLDPTMDVEEDDETGVLPDRPDLVLIDGGAGQLNVAYEALAELGVSDVTLLGVAKGPDRDAGREHIHMKGRGPFMLEPRDPVLYFIQRLRDEAHRFAIGTHRAKRSKAIGANPLDEIAGIGPTRKRALLAHFGSAKAVSRAGVEDLKAVAGISAEMAQKIYDFFHERKN